MSLSLCERKNCADHLIYDEVLQRPFSSADSCLNTNLGKVSLQCYRTLYIYEQHMLKNKVLSELLLEKFIKEGKLRSFWFLKK